MYNTYDKIHVTCGTQAKQKHICGNSKAGAHKSFFFLPFLVWRDMLPKIQTHLDVSQTQQALSSFCERCAVRPDPREQTLIAQNEATYIYRLSSSRFRLSYSKVRQKAFSDFVQFRHTQSLLHMWDELTANISMNPFRAA